MLWIRLLCLLVQDVCKNDGLLACDISNQNTLNRHAFPRPRTQHSTLMHQKPRRAAQGAAPSWGQDRTCPGRMACHAGNTKSRQEEGPLAQRFQSTETHWARLRVGKAATLSGRIGEPLADRFVMMHLGSMACPAGSVGYRRERRAAGKQHAAASAIQRLKEGALSLGGWIAQRKNYGPRICFRHRLPCTGASATPYSVTDAVSANAGLSGANTLRRTVQNAAG